MTKKMAEDLTEYLLEQGLRFRCQHSTIETIERIETLRALCLVELHVFSGSNLLREGLDLPEVSLVAILDADKEGFLRSGNALIQTIGRAARHVEGMAILYADKMTDSMQMAIDETNRRRAIQEAYNQKHGIEPKGIVKGIRDLTDRVKILAETRPEYAADGKPQPAGMDLEMLPRGELEKLIRQVDREMKEAAKALEFERAALLRDQITVVRRVRADQAMTAAGAVDADAIGLRYDDGGWCVAVLMVRGGRVLGSRNFFPRATADTETPEVLAAFVAQHYLEQPAPAEVLLPEAIDDGEALAAVLGGTAGHPVALRHRVRAIRQRWLALAADNASQGLKLRQAAGASLRVKLEAVAALLGLPALPKRIECFDISHTGGGETVASCVVFGETGPVKADYRRFNIRTAEPGDDYAAIAEAVERRYTRVARCEAPIPDLVLIDGGAGQRSRAAAVLAALELADVPVVGVGLEKRDEIIRTLAGGELSPPRHSPR